VIRALVIEPVGRKANWSSKRRDGGGQRMAGYTYVEITTLSKSLESTGVIEIGRKSGSAAGFDTLEIGTIQEDFHCFGTTDCAKETLNRSVIGLQNTGADSLKNHAGSPSKPETKTELNIFTLVHIVTLFVWHFS
jgi:hypothetical protein